MQSVARSPWRDVKRFTIHPHAATPGTGIKSPTFRSLLPDRGLLSLRAARSSAFAAYAAPPYEATAMAQATACLRNAVCVQLAHVLAWLSNLPASMQTTHRKCHEPRPSPSPLHRASLGTWCPCGTYICALARHWWPCRSRSTPAGLLLWQRRAALAMATLSPDRFA